MTRNMNFLSWRDWIRYPLSRFGTVIHSILLCCLFIGPALAVGPDLSGYVINVPVKASLVLPSGMSVPLQSVPPVPASSVVSPGENTLVSQEIMSGLVIGEVKVPDASLSNGLARMKEVIQPVRKQKEDGVVASESAGQTTRVSLSSDGQLGSGYSENPSISSDGRYVAFESYASSLIPDDINGYVDVFVHDRNTGSTTIVSVDSTGTQGNGNSCDPSISSDGRYVAFNSKASNLVQGDTNGLKDVFVHDRNTGTTTRVSVSSDGTQRDGDPKSIPRSSSMNPSISSDGRYVAFNSEASNLVPDDTEIFEDVFIHDRTNGTTTRVSVASDGTQGNFDSSDPSISSDGRYVAFDSGASNLVPDFGRAWSDVFVHDRITGKTTIVSVDSSGEKYFSISENPSISSDGRYVAFDSEAKYLVPGDTNNRDDIFVHERITGTTTRVSIASDGTQGNGNSDNPSISSDGRYVAFHSGASNLVPGDTNNLDDIFVYDRQMKTTTRVSVATDGTQGNGRSGSLSISSDGRSVAFESWASNLVPGDTNGDGDIFVHEIGGTPAHTPTITSISSSTGVNTGSVGITINGTNFATGTNAVNLTKSGQPNIPATNVNRLSATQITCTLPLTGKATGTWNVVLTTGGQTVTKANGFTITSATASGETIGVVRNRNWYLDYNGNGRWDTADKQYTFGLAGDIPVFGDWNGDGTTDVGVVRNRNWYLDYDGNGRWNTGDKQYTFGLAGDKPVIGDWNGDGTADVGVVRDRNWYLDYNGNGRWDTADRQYRFGLVGDIPVTGDWNGDGTTDVGVVRDRNWYLDYNGNGRWDAGDRQYRFGLVGDIPVTGNWAGTTATASIESVNPNPVINQNGFQVPTVSRPAAAVPSVEVPVKSSPDVRPALPGSVPLSGNPLVVRGVGQVN